MRIGWLLICALGGLQLSARDLDAPRVPQSALRNPHIALGGGPDGYGYSYQSTQDPGDTVHYQWIDAASGTPVTDWTPNPDDGYAALTLPFAFPFYDETLTTINVCSNGFLATSASTLYQNTTLPAPDLNNLIAGFWDDLAPTRGGTVYQYTTPGNSAFVVAFVEVCRYDPPYAWETFEFVLYPDGRIRLNYQRVNGDRASNTIGIQGDAGANEWFLQYIAGGNPAEHVVQDSTSILYYLDRKDHDVGATTVRSPGPFCAPGASQPVTARVRNFGRQTESFLVAGFIFNEFDPHDTVFVAAPVPVTDLAPQETALVALGEFRPDYVGTWRIKLFTALVGDEERLNDTARSLTTNSAPLGTTLASWNLGLGVGYALAGITFADDSNRFYLTLSDPNRVASFSPDDPASTFREEAFALQDFFGNDVVWGIAYDTGRHSFWIGHVEAAGNGTVVARYDRNGAFAGDTWNLWAVESNGWFAGMDYRPDCDQFLTVKVGGSNRLYQLDYAGKQVNRMIPGPVSSYRACSYLDAPAPWLISGGWNQNRLYHLDTLGTTIEFAPLDSFADADVYDPRSPCPDSLVYVMATLSNQGNTVKKISLGFTWRQLGVRAGPEPKAPGPAVVLACPSPQANPVRVSAFLAHAAVVRIAIYDLLGRQRAVLAPVSCAAGPAQLVITEPLAPGAYFLTARAGDERPQQKLVVVR